MIKKKLTDIACKNAKPEEKPRKLFDGGGLYLEVMPNGSKYWRLKYRHGGKEKRLAFGVYPEVSLKDAREKREKTKKIINDRVDPSEVKKQEKKCLYVIKNTKNYFAEKSFHLEYKGILKSYGIEIESRYNKCWEIMEMMNFTHLCAIEGIQPYIKKVFYDSKANLCSIEENPIMGTYTNREISLLILNLAKKSISQFEWINGVEHGEPWKGYAMLYGNFKTNEIANHFLNTNF